MDPGDVLGIFPLLVHEGYANDVSAYVLGLLLKAGKLEDYYVLNRLIIENLPR